jgi:hypothetical protein
MANHTIQHMRARYPFEMSEGALEKYSQRFFAGCGIDWTPKVQTCRLPPTNDGSGMQRQWFVTRVGPLPMGPDAYKCIALIPAMPTDIDGGTTFVVSSSDSYLADMRDGQGPREVGYPPLHPHHANSFVVGYHPKLTAKPLPASAGGIFADWYPWAAYTTHQLMTTGAQASMNSPGFNADFVGCRPGAELGACFFLKLPAGTGFPVYKATDLWSSSLVNRAGSWREPPGGPGPMLVTWEFGRQFATASTAPRARARPASLLTPVWTLDFAAVGNGNTYEIGRYKHLEGVVFHSYTFPVSGRVHGSWYHTHAQAKSEMWVLSGKMEELLPMKLLSLCQERGICRPTGGGSHGTVTTAVPLNDLGYDTQSLQQHILQRVAETGLVLRCQYRSMADLVDGQLWGRASLRNVASRATCDNWAFKAGDSITLVAFSPSGLPAPTPQHHRWWPVVELHIPKPAAMAGFKVTELLGGSVNLSRSDLQDGRGSGDHSNDWMEYMG